MENDLTIIPVLNKIDLPSSDVERVSEEVMNLLGCTREEIIPVSAKTGENVETILDAVLERIPEPRKLDNESNLVPVASLPLDKEGRGDLVSGQNPPNPLSQGGIQTKTVKALIFDSQYDPYKGVVVYLKLFSGEIKK
jgi:GTP-binding protein LepA